MTRKILIVDDDRLCTTFLRVGLMEKQYDVRTAHDGREGIALLRAEPPDLVILDIQMPQMSGFEFLNEMKSIPSARGIPVIILTSNGEMRDVFLSEGVKGYFVKPVDMPPLQARIAECLGA